MKYIFAIVFILPILVNAQYKHYKGTIGTDLQVVMDINIFNDMVSGVYYYQKIGLPLNLSGKKTQNSFEFKEFNESQKETGVFRLVMNDNKATGTWTGNGKSLNVNLVEDYSNSLKLETLSYKDSIVTSKSYGMRVSYDLCIPYKHLNSGKNPQVVKAICDSILSEFYIKNLADINPNVVKAKLKEHAQKEMKEFQKYIADPEVKETCDSSPFMCDWESTQSGSPVFNQNQILSYHQLMFSYMGGAHGTYAGWCTNFNLANGKIIKLEDLFVPNYEKTLKNLLTAKIKKMFQTEDLASVNMDDVFVTEYFQIHYSGLRFIYNPYEIGPFSIGSPEVFIPYSELKPLMKQGHPLTWVQ